MSSHHVNEPLVHEDSHTQQEGEHEFVLLKKTATHIAVQAEGKIRVYVLDTLLHRF